MPFDPHATAPDAAVPSATDPAGDPAGSEARPGGTTVDTARDPAPDAAAAGARPAPVDPATACDAGAFSVDCPARLLFDQVADKWSMMIMTVLEAGPTRFNELRRRLTGVSQKSLSTTLKRLERNGIVERRVVDTNPPGVLYRMTPLGRTLLPPFQAIYRWAHDNMQAVEAARSAYDAGRGRG